MLELEVDADGAAQLGGQPRAQGEDLVEGRDRVAPSYAVLACRRSGTRSTARSVRSCASVRSSTNQPSGLRRWASSGWAAMSVVAESSASWRATSTPSAVQTRSGSTKSAPHPDGQLVAREGVLGPVAGRAPVPDDDRCAHEAHPPGPVMTRSRPGAYAG